MKNNLKKRILSLFLSVMMVIGMIPSASLTAFAAGDLVMNASVGGMVAVTKVTVKNVDGSVTSSSATAAEVQLNEQYDSIDIVLTSQKKGGPSNVSPAAVSYSVNGGTTNTFTQDSANTGYANISLTPEWNEGKYTAAISISTPGVSGTTYTLTFTAPLAAASPVQSVALDKESETIKVGANTTFSATVTYEDASTDNKVNWTSSDETVATVDSNGVVTGKKAGTATITATTKGKDANEQQLSASCTVTVENVDAEGISLNKTSTEIAVGYTDTLTATVTPDNATFKGVLWSSSNESIATVDANGVVTGKAAGTATITATTEGTDANGQQLTANCEVTVKTVSVEAVALNKAATEIEIGKTEQLSASFTPEQSTNKNVTWTSSDQSIATVDTNGVVTAVAAGTATITATTEDGGKTASCAVTVKKVYVDGISLDQTDLSIYTNGTKQLTATVSPQNATDKGVVWSSSDETVATVDANGVVTALAVGTATITAKSAENDTITAACYVTVTYMPDHVLALNISTSNGAVKTVTFTDSKGNPLAVAQRPILDGTTIKVMLSKDVAENEKITATFDLTQNNDLPFLTTTTNASGVSSKKAVNNKFTEKGTTLSGGKATFTFYMYNETPTVRNNKYTTYTISYETANSVPALTGKTEGNAQTEANKEYKISLAGLFADADGDTISYKYSTDGTNYTAFDGDEYTFVQSISGEYKVYFKANDGLGDSDDVYTVTVTVTNSNVLYDTKVVLPQDITPQFYITQGTASDGTDTLGEALQAQKGATADGKTIYTVSIPDNITRISVRGKDADGADWGGMCFDTKDADGTAIANAATLVKVQGKIVDYGKNEVEGEISSAAYGDYKAVKGAKGYLLCADEQYTFTATPSNTTYYKTATAAKTVQAVQDVFVVEIEVPYNNPKTITAPTGAKAQFYKYNKYYDNTEYQPFAVKDNGDGTSTTYFLGTSGDIFIYRVTYKDYIVKAGWTSSNVTVTFDENDLKSDARINYKNSTEDYAKMAEDNVLLNINRQNNLVLSTGGTKTLKAYRAWEIIPVSYNNWIITPDFHYNIISGSDVVSLTDKKSLSTTDTDWKTITALKEGTAVIEVSYDAVQVSGSASFWTGVYGASDPARTGLMVVQVGGHDSSVNFGIDSFASQGSTIYSADRAKNWDAEFDTLYFTGNKGSLRLSPTADSTIQRVQVSHDKGESWQTLIATDGVYTAPIAHGNNIIRVITDNGTAYQVVRGYKTDVSYRILDDNGNGTVDAGETVRVTLSQLHQPIPKMAGNYNPGYRGNQDGDGGTHMVYTFNGQTVTGAKAQYETSAITYIDVTIPADTDQTSFTLSDGYLATGVIGFTSFNDGGDSHRNIPDSGCATRASTSSFHTRGMLPEITINLGDASAPNSAPYAKGNATAAAQIELGQNFAINPETLFADNDGDVLEFTYSVNGTDKGAADKTFTFTPDAKGEYVLKFTASDGKLTAQHTLVLTVVEATSKDTALKFDIASSDIKGYVQVSFEDNGIRPDGSYGYKYPVALGTIIPSTRVPFAEGDTIAEVTIRLLDAMKIGYEYTGSVTSGFYLGTIKNFAVNNTPYDSMGQFDAGEGSGWMISCNDWFIDQGASEFVVKNGDNIQWKFTCQLGADIGDNSWEAVVGEVEALIDAIGTPVTLDSIEKVTAARSAYDNLSEFYKSKVENYNDLLEAERVLKHLIDNGATEEDKQAAENVDTLISGLGTVTLDSAEAIEKARAEYEQLSPLQKQLVNNLEALETAENQLRQLNSASHEEVYKNTGNYIASLGTPAVGTTGGEWMTIGLARGNKGLSATTAQGYYNGVVQYMENVFGKNTDLKTTVRLDENKSTDNSRVILALTAAGFDATNVEGYNLFSGLDKMEYISYQGINGPIWALIALNSHPSYKDELGGDVTEEKLIEAVLSAQLSDSGWDLSATAADVDMTAMALQALAPYYNSNAKVKGAVDKALSKLSSMQQPDGSFASVDGKNSESTAQVIVALTALGINPEEDSRFIKKGMSAVDALCEFAVSGGGFMHTPGTQLDGMATEQGYYALVSYFRLLNSETSLYDMSDVTLKKGNYNSNVASAYDQQAAEEAEKLISNIGEVKLESYSKIEKARNAYDKLTEKQKKLVDNYNKLLEAEDEAVDQVEDLIDKIGEVGYDSSTDVEAAKKAYNYLPDYLQKKVSNYDKLNKAEVTLKDLRAEAVELLASGKLVLSKSELLELVDSFEAVTENTGYDAVLALMRTYSRLGEKQQLALKDTEGLKLAQQIIASYNHTDASTGITTDDLDWNIRLVVEDTEDDTAEKAIASAIENSTVLEIWNIYLEDVLTGERYSVDKAVEIKVPADLLGDWEAYDELSIVYYAQDGTMEAYNCKVADGYVVFNAADFNIYAAVGIMAGEETQEEENTENLPTVTAPNDTETGADANSGWLIWVIIAAVGVAALVGIIVLKKRTEDEE